MICAFLCTESPINMCTLPISFINVDFLLNQRYQDFIISNATIKINNIRCYLSPNSTMLKLCNQKYEDVAIQKISKPLIDTLMQFHFWLQSSSAVKFDNK